MKNYTKIPNEMLNQSQLSIPARYLYCVLVKHCGQNETCYPGQERLGKTLGITPRHIRHLLNELLLNGLILKKRTGYNKPNTYTVTKDLITYRKGASYHVGNKFPFQRGTTTPANSTYRKGKANKGMEKLADYLIEKRILK